MGAIFSILNNIMNIYMHQQESGSRHQFGGNGDKKEIFSQNSCVIVMSSFMHAFDNS